MRNQNSEAQRKRATTHGMTKTSTYTAWRSMKRRCTLKTDHSYTRYGERGITICARWLLSFENFLADMGEKPEGFYLDRIDNNGGYELGNCRWVDAKTSTWNRECTRYVEVEGKSVPIMEAARLLGLGELRLYHFINKYGEVEGIERAKNAIVRKHWSMTYKGITQSASRWAEEYGIDRGTVRYRISRGLSPEEVLGV